MSAYRQTQKLKGKFKSRQHNTTEDKKTSQQQKIRQHNTTQDETTQDETTQDEQKTQKNGNAAPTIANKITRQDKTRHKTRQDTIDKTDLATSDNVGSG